VPVAPIAMPSSIEDTVNFLRRPQPGDAPAVSEIGARWRARALAAGSEPLPNPVEAAWPPVVESIDPRDAVQWPDDVGIAAPAAARHGGAPVGAPPVAPFFPPSEPEPSMEPAAAWPLPGTLGGDAPADAVVTPFDAGQWASVDTGTDGTGTVDTGTVDTGTV